MFWAQVFVLVLFIAVTLDSAVAGRKARAVARTWMCETTARLADIERENLLLECALTRDSRTNWTMCSVVHCQRKSSSGRSLATPHVYVPGECDL